MGFLKTTINVLAVMGVMFLMTSAAQAQNTWYVDDDGDPANGCTSWLDACPELQKALDLANSGDEIWVAAGIYKPDYDVGTGQHTGDREATFQLINGVAIYGGFPDGGGPWESRDPDANETILSGDLNGDDNFVTCAIDDDCGSNGGLCRDELCIIPDNNDENSYHVVTGSGTDETALIDGFAITAGNADGPWEDDSSRGGGMYNNGGSPTVTNCTSSGNSAGDGGGMYNDNNSSPTVTNCTFNGNSAVNWAGGMYNWDSNPTVIKCGFVANTTFGPVGGGGMHNISSSPTVTSCTFVDNWCLDSGGGMVNQSSNPTVRNCTFTGNSGNSGSGMSNYWGSSVTLIDCTFSGNSATHYGGAMYNQGSSTTLTNCTFNGNWASLGGGMYNWESTPTVTNCTFSSNSAINGRALAFDRGPSTLELTNCILWDGGGEIWNNDGSTITITHSDIQGGWPGEGNIDSDPLFVDADGPDNIPGTEDDNLHLLPDSPCVNKGNNDVPQLPEYDFEGDARIQHCRVDMGVDETPYYLDCQPDGIGDVCQGGPWYYGDVNNDNELGLTDLICLLDGLRGLFTCPGVTFEDLDIHPCEAGNSDLNLFDLLNFLDALRGQPPCPDPCP